MVFETVVATILNKALGSYVENLDASQMNLGIWGGNVVLNNLNLKDTALDDLDLPVKLKSGFLEKLSLKIPWKNLYTEAVVAEVQGLYVLAVPNAGARVSVYNAEKEEKTMVEAKKAELRRIEAAKEKPAKQDTFVEKMTAQVIKNLQVIIRNIHIRYEDQFSNRDRPFALGVTLHELCFQTTDDNWKPCIVKELTKIIYKVSDQMKSFAVYWNFNCKLVSDLVLLPISIGAYLKLNPKPETDGTNFKTPKIRLSITVDKLGLNIEKFQYQGILEFLEAQEQFALNAKYRKYRPFMLPYHNHMKEWWHFAMNCILETQVRRVARNWSWSHIKQHRELVKQYELAWLEKRTVKNISSEKLAIIDKAEKQLDVFNLIIARQQAELQIKRRGLKLVEEQGGWMSWVTGWWGGGGGEQKAAGSTANEIASQFEKAMTDEEKEKLYQAIDYQENQVPTQYPPEVTNIFVFSLVLEMGLQTVESTLEMRPSASAIKFESKIGMFEIKGSDEKTEHAVVPILSPVLGKEEEASLFSQLTFNFETNPLDHSCDQRISLLAQPLVITYHAYSINRLICVLRPPESVRLKQLTDAAMLKYEDIKSKSSTGLQHAMKYRKRMKVDLEILPTVLRIPDYGDYERFNLIVRKVAPIKVHIDFRSFYTFIALFTLSDSQGTFDLDLATALLEPTGFKIVLQTAIVDDVKLPKTRICGTLPDLCVNISDVYLLKLLKLLLSIPTPPPPQTTKFELKDETNAEDFNKQVQLEVKFVLNQMLQRKDETSTTVILKTVAIDYFDRDSRYKKVRTFAQILDVMGEEMFRLECIQYTRDKDQVVLDSSQQVDMCLIVRLAKMRFIFLNLWLNRLLNWLSPFQTAAERTASLAGTAIQERARNAVEALQKGDISRIKLDVLIETPVIVLPASSKSTKLLPLGKLTVGNEFSYLKLSDGVVVLDKIVFLGKDSWTLGDERELLRPITFTISVVRNLSFDFYQTVPRIAVEGRLPEIEIRLTSEDYSVLMAILSENLAEVEETPASPPPSEPIAPSSAAGKGANEKLAETTSTARKSTVEMKALFALERISVTLYRSTDAQMFANGEMTANFSLKAFTLDDLRKGSIGIRRLLDKKGGSTDGHLLSASFEKTLKMLAPNFVASYLRPKNRDVQLCKRSFGPNVFVPKCRFSVEPFPIYGWPTRFKCNNANKDTGVECVEDNKDKVPLADADSQQVLASFSAIDNLNRTLLLVQMSFEVEQISFCLEADCGRKKLPMIFMRSSLSGDISSWTCGLIIMSTVRCEIWYFNDNNNAWEPVLEPMLQDEVYHLLSWCLSFLIVLMLYFTNGLVQFHNTLPYDVELYFKKQENLQYGMKLLANGSEVAPPLTYVCPAVLPLQILGFLFQLKMKVGDSGWSSGFPVDSVGSAGRITCTDSLSFFQFSVKPSISEFGFTKICTITPFYQLKNMGKEKQVETFFFCVGFWPDQKRNLFCIVRIEGTEEESQPFPFTDTFETLCRLNNKVKAFMYIVHSVSDSGVTIAFYDYEDGMIPAMVINHFTSVEAQFKQTYDGYEEFFLARDHPAYCISFLNGRQRTILFTDDLAVCTNARQIYELEAADSEILVSLHGVGLSLMNDSIGKEVAYIALRSTGAIWEQKKKRFRAFPVADCRALETAYTKYLADIDFTEMKITKPVIREIRRSFQSGLTLQYRQSQHDLQIHVRINSIQIDNQLSGCVFRTMFAPTPVPKSVFKVAFAVPKPFIEFTHIVRNPEHSTIPYVQYCKLLVQEMAVKVDQGFLNALMSMFASTSARTRSVYFNRDSVLQPFSFMDVSFVQRGSTSEESQAPFMLHTELLSLLLKGVGVTLTEIQDVVLKLAYFERRSVFMSKNTLISEATGHYVKQVIMQLYVLVLGLDVLGNPFGLIRDLSTGVEQFFYEPIQGAIEGPEEFAEGLVVGVRSLFGHALGGTAGAVSRITGTLGKGIAALTMDADYQKRRQEMMNKRPADLTSGIARGGTGAIMGVVDGVTGVFVKPIEGAREEGAIGFAKGLGKGLIGMVTRPVSGVVDFASSSLEAVKKYTNVCPSHDLLINFRFRAADVSEEVKRIRLPRYVGQDKIVRPYSPLEAEGGSILQVNRFLSVPAAIHVNCIILYLGPGKG
ncbi:Vacuolar protein sorting associated protein 13A [Trichuris trichiura]|uniref:Vacuolar protein sorting associated protein 13A n=1 Tax=Trichuris trichiura TaxID=36087 RepID=A0A077YX84_TRITR|nr:Vacuolar protein sorting associated protein 13A [Trichuris trichiura]